MPLAATGRPLISATVRSTMETSSINFLLCISQFRSRFGLRRVDPRGAEILESSFLVPKGRFVQACPAPSQHAIRDATQRRDSQNQTANWCHENKQSGNFGQKMKDIFSATPRPWAGKEGLENKKSAVKSGL